MLVTPKLCQRPGGSETHAHSHTLFFYAIFPSLQMSTQQGSRWPGFPPCSEEVYFFMHINTHKHTQSSMAMFFSLSEGRLTLLIRTPPPLALGSPSSLPCRPASPSLAAFVRPAADWVAVTTGLLSRE